MKFGMLNPHGDIDHLLPEAKGVFLWSKDLQIDITEHGLIRFGLDT